MGRKKRKSQAKRKTRLRSLRLKISSLRPCPRLTLAGARLARKARRVPIKASRTPRSPQLPKPPIQNRSRTLNGALSALKKIRRQPRSLPGASLNMKRSRFLKRHRDLRLLQMLDGVPLVPKIRKNLRNLSGTSLKLQRKLLLRKRQSPMLLQRLVGARLARRRTRRRVRRKISNRRYHQSLSL